MNMISRDERKKQKGLKKFINSFTYPIKGTGRIVVGGRISILHIEKTEGRRRKVYSRTGL